MTKQLSRLCSLVFVFFILACGGPEKALISQSEIQNAKANGQLEALWQKANNAAKQTSGSEQKSAIALREQIADLLIQDRKSQIDVAFSEAAKSDAGLVTRAKLLSLKDAIASMQQWRITEFNRQSQRLDKALADTNSAIKKARTQAGKYAGQITANIEWLKRAAHLAGEGQPEYENYLKAQSAAVNQLLSRGNDAMTKRMFSTAKSMAEQGLMIDPGNLQFEALASQAAAGLFEQEFRFALENGKPETAYQSLLDVADKPVFRQIKKKMGKNISLLANFFAGNARTSYLKNDFASAYRDFKRGRQIQQMLGVTKQGFVQERGFLDKLMARARSKDMTAGRKYALLRAVKEFDPAYPGLESAYLKAQETVKKRALTKLKVDKFDEVANTNPVISSVGRRIGSKLETILFEQLGNEVSIVATVPATDGSGYDGLVLAIDGEMLQAAIEVSKNEGTRTVNAQTGVRREETEEYADWKKRKRGQAPKQYNEYPITEDISLKVTHIKKVAIAEVAYRIIEPSTGKILLTDTLLQQAKFQGESINEYQKGDFHQPFVEADLPTDIAIMDQLSSKLAQELGNKLQAYLAKPEAVFYQKANTAREQGLPIRSIELLANALVIAEAKGETKAGWYEQMLQIAFALK